MIVVTGGTGLVGSHLLYELTLGGNKVRALRRESSDIGFVLQIFKYYTVDAEILFNQIEWIEGDIQDPVSLDDAINEGDVVYHAAALVSFAPGKKREIFKNNISGTANIVNTCLKKKVVKLCYVSSVAALGSSEDGLPVTENLIWSPSKKHSNYSISKFHSEMEVWRGAEEGLNVVIVNPSIILGPGNWASGSSALFYKIYKGLKFYTPGVTGYVDVRDLVKVMVQLMKSNISSERFILNAENCSFEQIFKNISRELKKPAPKYKLKKWLGAFAWRFEYIRSKMLSKQPLITKETMNAAFNNSFYSSNKVKEKLNFSFIPIEQSIKDICKIFLANH